MQQAITLSSSASASLSASVIAIDNLPSACFAFNSVVFFVVLLCSYFDIKFFWNLLTFLGIMVLEGFMFLNKMQINFSSFPKYSSLFLLIWLLLAITSYVYLPNNWIYVCYFFFFLDGTTFTWKNRYFWQLWIQF